jgi:hypothetical protein
MLKLHIRRQPLSDHSYFAEKSYEATLFVGHLGICDEDQRWIELRFATNADGQRVSVFDLAIYPRNFAELAKLMIEADPVIAIRAFGAAMQIAEVERRRGTASDEVVTQPGEPVERRNPQY